MHFQYGLGTSAVIKKDELCQVESPQANEIKICMIDIALNEQLLSLRRYIFKFEA